MDYEYMQPIIQKIHDAPMTKPPAPWLCKNIVAVGGLRSVGFRRDSDLLLVVSSQGRGVLNCATGEKIARDSSQYDEDDCHLEAEGIGPLAGQRISVAGLYGGGLPNGTSDLWHVISVSLQWPESLLLLVHPGSSLYGSRVNRPDHFTKIAKVLSLHAYGFSPTGKSLIIATSSDVTIYHREA